VMLNLAIGQGELLTTPIELVSFFAGIVNHGVVMKPHLLLSTQSADGSVDYSSPEPLRKLPFSDDVSEVLMEACRLVVNGEHGTAKWPKLSEVEMAGKTGTAQNPHGNEHSWFVGYAPARDPEIVGCFIVEQAGHGSAVAAPFVKTVIKRHFNKKILRINRKQIAAEMGES